MAKKHDVHVTRLSSSRWKVTQGGDVLSTHGKQSLAIDAARREAKRDRVDLVTHSHDGRIRSKDSFGSDRHPPRDRKR
jgi:hypothetical protein